MKRKKNINPPIFYYRTKLFETNRMTHYFSYDRVHIISKISKTFFWYDFVAKSNTDSNVFWKRFDWFSSYFTKNSQKNSIFLKIEKDRHNNKFFYYYQVLVLNILLKVLNLLSDLYSRDNLPWKLDFKPIKVTWIIIQ